MRLVAHDLLGGIVWVVLGVAVSLGSVALRLGTLDRPGPGFMPFITGVALALAGLALTLSSVSRARQEPRTDGPSLARFRERGASVMAASFLYVLLLEPLGFVISTALFLFALVELLGVRKLSQAVLFSVTTVIASYLLFAVWLRLNLPRGVLGIG